MSLTLLSLPRNVLESVLSYLSFDEVSKARETCKTFDDVCGGILNRGFRQLERKLAAHQAALRSKLPRRESERRTHPLSRHCEVLSAIETRLSLLKMSIMRYADDGHCCFFAGRVLDEINRVCRSVQLDSDMLVRPYKLLNEMRDISSMAIEHFEDILLPMIRRRVSSAAVHSATWEPLQSTSNSTTNLSFHSLSSSSQEDVLFRSSQDLHQRSAVSPAANSATHCVALERRVKRLEQAQVLNRSRLSVSLRALSQLYIRLRETSEQNKRLGAMVTAQSRRIQRLEALTGTTSSVSSNLESVGPNPPVSCEAANLDRTCSRKRSALTDSLARRQQHSRAWSDAVKRARKMELSHSTRSTKDT